MTSPVLVIMGGLFVLALAIGVSLWSFGRGVDRSETARDYERRRLYFAAVVLIGLGFIFIIAMSMYYFAPDAQLAGVGKEIFTTCVTVIPPIVTLVLGYYFGKAETQREPKLPAQGAGDNGQLTDRTEAIDVSPNSA